MDDTVDILRIKIEEAKTQLSGDTLNAINAVPWQDFIISLREKYGYTFEQLDALDLETELVLYGLTSPEDYPKELEKRMGILKPAVDRLLNEMNIGVFSRIKEEMIKNTERKKTAEERDNMDNQILKDADIDFHIIQPKIITPLKENVPGEKITENRDEILKGLETSETEVAAANNAKIQSILASKLTSAVPTKVVKTDHTLENLTKPGTIPPPVAYSKNADPYRLPPE